MALAALHREDIVHGDIKPSNIMLKRTGNAKIIDIGSAFEMDNPPPIRTCTPFYAAPEVLDGGEMTPRSDLASLGYVLIELLSGRQPFAGMKTYRELLEAKRTLPQQLLEDPARRSDVQRTVDELLPGPDRARSATAVPGCRSRHAAQGRGRRVPPAIGQGRHVQRIRQRGPFFPDRRTPGAGRRRGSGASLRGTSQPLAGSRRSKCA